MTSTAGSSGPNPGPVKNRPKPPPPVVPLRFLMIVRGPRTFVLDRAVIRLTGYSLGCWQIALHRREKYYPTLLLTAMGRTSRRLRDTALPYVEIGGEYVIVASLGGGPVEPDWAKNLRANPECWVRVRRRQIPTTARVLEGEERRRALATVGRTRRSALGYDERAASHGREMAIFALEPIISDTR